MDEGTKKRLERESNAAWVAVWKPFADAGDADAQFELGMFHESYGDDADQQAAAALLRKACEQGHAEACWNLSRTTKGEEGKRLLLRAAELGHAWAQRDLGAYYATGSGGFPKDLSEALRWYRLGAENGNSDAQYNLGVMYLRGEGTPPNAPEGLLLVKRSAEQGHWSAIRYLADIYREGHYRVTADPDQADFWDKKGRELFGDDWC